MPASPVSVILLTLMLPLLANVAPPTGAQGVGSTTRSEVAAALRQGGYVIYLRHTATDQTALDSDRASLRPCKTERILSDAGRQQARELGRAFRALEIPVGKVLVSSSCRAVDTGQLAFGRTERSDALYDAIESTAGERERRNTDLRRLLATPPAPRTNTVLVSHHANLKDATGIWPKQEGTVEVFRPDPARKFEHVAEVSLEKWSQWARAHSHR